MSEGIRFLLKDSTYARLVLSLMQNISGSAIDMSDFNPSLSEMDRILVVDTKKFGIVRRVVSQSHEVPGINLVFYDEDELEFRNPADNKIGAAIHVYVVATDNIIADDRTMDKICTLLDRALAGGGVSIWDYSASPPSDTGKIGYWFSTLSAGFRWHDLTNLGTDTYLHRAKNFEIIFRDNEI